MNQPSKYRGTVMVLEDDHDLRRGVTRVLQLQGYHVVEAASAHEALTALDEHPDPIDVLLCDLVLPGLDGREAAILLQAKRPGMKILFTSGYLSHGSGRQDLINAGQPFLQKPFDVPGLVSALDALLPAAQLT